MQGRPKLDWRRVTDDYYILDFYSMLRVDVWESKVRWRKGKWGIMLGERYYSLEKDLWWDSRDVAMLKAEELLEKLVCRIEDMLHHSNGISQ